MTIKITNETPYSWFLEVFLYEAYLIDHEEAIHKLNQFEGYKAAKAAFLTIETLNAFIDERRKTKILPWTSDKPTKCAAIEAVVYEMIDQVLEQHNIPRRYTSQATLDNHKELMPIMLLAIERLDNMRSNLDEAQRAMEQ